MVAPKRNDSRGRWQVSGVAMVVHLMVGAVCFYAGVMVGVSIGFQDSQTAGCPQATSSSAGAATPRRDQETPPEPKTAEAKLGLRFPLNVEDFMVGMSQVERGPFASRFDTGVPLDQPSKTNDRVVIMYNTKESLPSKKTVAKEATLSGDLPLMGIEEATENCDTLDMVLVQKRAKRQCFAFMGQYQSFHLQKWMRLPPTIGQPLDPKAPLRLVNRGAQSSGRLSAKPPQKSQTLEYWKSLHTYLGTLDGVLEQLKPIAEKVARKNTVIVMVCNHGQSELLMNFVCSAKSRGIDLTPVLLFATDVETKELAEGLGLTAFYDEQNYGYAPKQAARSYGDRAFTAMMMAKVYCVQMISMLGYDLLFQDVDMVWFKDPLEYFHDANSPSHGFDVYFQDDGSRGLFYAPYSANTGFYYVRANDRTRNFFNALLMAGDLIISAKSHQIALVSLLSEHTSMYGMKVKVLARDTNEFPGGHAFHYRKGFMKDIFSGKEHPYIFHMSWTLNKDNKQKFIKQMGEWYLQDNCAGSTLDKIHGEGKNTKEKGSLVAPCCSKEPMFKCFYKDKPSKKPCKDSPPIDKNGKSFW